MDNLESMLFGPSLLCTAVNRSTFVLFPWCIILFWLDVRCSSPQREWGGDPRQQTNHRVFWSGRRPWRWILVAWKRMRGSEVAGLLHAAQLLHNFQHIHVKCNGCEKRWADGTCLASVAGSFCSYANLKWWVFKKKKSVDFPLFCLSVHFILFDDIKKNAGLFIC